MLKKRFDRLYLELQVALLLLAGVGLQGYTEWQCANMVNRTNKLVTDIFVALLQYKCGLPQGTGFSVEIANLYAMLLLLWWFFCGDSQPIRYATPSVVEHGPCLPTWNYSTLHFTETWISSIC
jgi:hypothetical protein